MAESTVESSPTAIRLYIGGELKRLRKANGINRDEVASHLMKTAAWPGHLESARHLPSASDLGELLTWYGHPDRIPFFRQLLARAKKGKDWWSTEVFTGAAPEWFHLYLGIESLAKEISAYDAMIVPGQLQTEDYARAVIRGALPHLPDDEVEQRVALRMVRQEVLARRQDAEPMTIHRILDEAALRRPIGGPQVHHQQLRQLVTLAELPNVTLQVLELSVGAHPSIEGPFTLLTYPEEFLNHPGTVYVEDRERGTYYEEPDEIEHFKDDLALLQRAALKADESVDFIRQLAKEIDR